MDVFTVYKILLLNYLKCSFPFEGNSTLHPLEVAVGTPSA